MKHAASAKVADMIPQQTAAITTRLQGPQRKRAFAADKCPGLTWLQAATAKNPDMTMADLQTAVENDDATLRPDWFVDLLIDQGSQLEPVFRLAMWQRLTPRQALRVLAHPISITETERALLRQLVQAKCATRPDLYAKQWAVVV